MSKSSDKDFPIPFCFIIMLFFTILIITIDWRVVAITAIIIVSVVVIGVATFYLVKKWAFKLKFPKKGQYKKEERLKKIREIQTIEHEIKENIIKQVNALIMKGDTKHSMGNFSSALQMYRQGYEIIIKHRNIVPPSLLEKIEFLIKESKEKLKIERENEIKALLKKGDTLKNSEKYEEAENIYKNALKIAKDLLKFQEKDDNIKNIKTKIDDTYSAVLKEMIYQAKELKNQSKYNNTIDIYEKTLIKAGQMYNTNRRNKEIEDINYYINQTYLDMLKPNIDKAHKLRDEFKYDGAIKNYNEAMQIALNLTDKNLKSKKVRDIRRYINEVKVAIIKSTILDLGTKFGRLEVKEVAEECGEDEELIVKTVKEMIEGKEIYAKYFDSSRAVAFNLQANIDEIDSLMDKYKQWEKEEKDKI